MVRHNIAIQHQAQPYVPNHQSLIMWTPIETQNSLRMPLERREWHRGGGSQVPQLNNGITIIRRGRHEMQALHGVPLNVTDCLGGSQLAPRFHLFEVPHRHETIGMRYRDNVFYLCVPRNLCD